MPLSGPEYNQRLIHEVEAIETHVEVTRGNLSLRPQIKLSAYCTGQEHLASIRLEQPKVVVLDIHRPDMNGMQVLNER